MTTTGYNNALRKLAEMIDDEIIMATKQQEMKTEIDKCASCDLVNSCDAWNQNGTWPHAKGAEPCRPVSLFDCPTDAAKADCRGCNRDMLCKLDRQRIKPILHYDRSKITEERIQPARRFRIINRGPVNPYQTWSFLELETALTMAWRPEEVRQIHKAINVGIYPEALERMGSQSLYVISDQTVLAVRERIWAAPLFMAGMKCLPLCKVLITPTIKDIKSERSYKYE
jgi:hypothetical protein